MFGRVLGLVCVVFMGVNCMANASGTTMFILYNEEASIKLGADVSKGTVSSAEDISKPFKEIADVANLTTGQRSVLMKNIYLASLYAGEPMTDFRTQCLSAMLEIAKNETNLPGSNNYKIAQLLYSSQTDGTDMYSFACTDVVENVINRLSSAVNGDKELALGLLQKFYGILSKDERFKCYVPAY